MTNSHSGWRAPCHRDWKWHADDSTSSPADNLNFMRSEPGPSSLRPAGGLDAGLCRGPDRRIGILVCTLRRRMGAGPSAEAGCRSLLETCRPDISFRLSRRSEGSALLRPRGPARRRRCCHDGQSHWHHDGAAAPCFRLHDPVLVMTLPCAASKVRVARSQRDFTLSSRSRLALSSEPHSLT